MKTQQPIKTHVLFVALTRQASAMGLPYQALAFECFLTLIVFTLSGNPLFLLMIVPLHLLFYAISAEDQGRFDAIHKWIITNGKCLNVRYWQAYSFSPNSFKVKKRKGVYHD